MILEFDWDNKKRGSNIKKHGIDFLDATQIFLDGERIEIALTRNDEDRIKSIGYVQGRILVVVYSFRKSKIIRIISARRAKRNERKKRESV